jgi:hypothetical protein
MGSLEKYLNTIKNRRIFTLMKKFIILLSLLFNLNAAYAIPLLYEFEGEVSFTNEGINNSFQIGDSVSYKYIIDLDRAAELALFGDSSVTTFSELDGIPAFYAEYISGDLPLDPVQNSFFNLWHYGNFTPENPGPGFYSAIQTFVPSLSFLFPTNFDSNVYEWSFSTEFTLQNIWVDDFGEEFQLEAQLGLVSVIPVTEPSTIVFLLGSIALLVYRKRQLTGP